MIIPLLSPLIFTKGHPHFWATADKCAVVRLRSCRPGLQHVSQLTSQSSFNTAFLCHPLGEEILQKSVWLCWVNTGCSRRASICFTSSRCNCMPNICIYINIPEVCQIQTLRVYFTPITQFLLYQRILQSCLAEGASSMQQ